MKAKLLRLLTGLGVKLSGPLGWLASLFVDRLLEWLTKRLKTFLAWAKDKFKANRERQNDQTNADHYDTTLQDGASETDQVDASLDLLNGRKPRD